MLHLKIKHFILLLGFILPATWCGANSTNTTDNYTHIQIIESQVQGEPKTSYIDASLDGHNLYVVFLDDLGRVRVEVTYADGGNVDALSTLTPNGVNFYIFDTGSYVVTFTLENGDTYFGEFEITE